MAISAKHLAELEKAFILADDKRLTFKGLFFGESGVGKTVESVRVAQIVTPADKKILFIDTSDGWVSLMNHPGLTDRLIPMEYQALAQYEALVEALKEGAGSFGDIGTVIFDEISTVSKRDMVSVAKATKLGEFDAAEFKHYNIATRRMERVLTKLLELRETHNLIFVSHMKERENKVTGVRKKEPSVMPAFAETLKESLHVVAFMSSDIKHDEKGGAPKFIYKMQVHPSKMTVAKTRIGGFDVIVSPDRFNERLTTWISRNDNTIEGDRPEVVLDDEVKVGGDSDEAPFTGYEVDE